MSGTANQQSTDAADISDNAQPQNGHQDAAAELASANDNSMTAAATCDATDETETGGSEKEGDGPLELSILSLNVHGWHNEEHASWTGLVAMLDAIKPDVIALQEATKHRVPALAKALGNLHWSVRHNCAILSRFELIDPSAITARSVKDSGLGKSRTASLRYNTATISPCEGLQIEIACVHLDHVRETTRLSQLRAIADHQLSPHREQRQIWLGDYNALTRSDCSEEMWARIADHRARSSWEAPVSEVSEMMTGRPQGLAAGRGGGGGGGTSANGKPRRSAPLPALGFTDCWSAAEERNGPLGTSRFNTRIDYIYASPALMKGSDSAAVVRRCDHFETIPHVSDHQAVFATLDLGVRAGAR